MASTDVLARQINIFWLLFNSFLIFTMQIGFAMLEAGAVRSKNTTSILFKCISNTLIGSLTYWATGFAFGFGGNGSNAFIGTSQFFLSNTNASEFAFVTFEMMFCLASSTIVSGAIAERMRIGCYLILNAIISSWIYPLVTHWVWDESGWMKNDMKYIDFAGSGVVHITGGAASLVAAVMVGPRIGRFKHGKAKIIPGHSIVLCALGFFLLWFGFLSFNAGSTLGIAGSDFQAGESGRAAINTLLSPASAGLTAMALARLRLGRRKFKISKREIPYISIFEGYWSVGKIINGSLTGLVAICAGANIYQPWAGVVVGIIAGTVYFIGSNLVESFFIDDPLDAIAVHMLGGFTGVICVAFFCDSYRAESIWEGGILYAWDGDSFIQLGRQVLGACVIAAWAMANVFVCLLPFKLTGIIRVTKEVEEEGMDFKDGQPAYPIDMAMIEEYENHIDPDEDDVSM